MLRTLSYIIEAEALTDRHEPQALVCRAHTATGAWASTSTLEAETVTNAARLSFAALAKCAIVDSVEAGLPLRAEVAMELLATLA